jgi:hypothetical protein
MGHVVSHRTITRRSFPSSYTRSLHERAPQAVSLSMSCVPHELANALADDAATLINGLKRLPNGTRDSNTIVGFDHLCPVSEFAQGVCAGRLTIARGTLFEQSTGIDHSERSLLLSKPSMNSWQFRSFFGFARLRKLSAILRVRESRESGRLQVCAETALLLGGMYPRPP